VQLGVEGNFDCLEIVIVDKFGELKSPVLRVLDDPIVHVDARRHILSEVYVGVAQLAFKLHLENPIHHGRNDAQGLLTCFEKNVNLIP
jgi:hypothetical protein